MSVERKSVPPPSSLAHEIAVLPKLQLETVLQSLLARLDDRQTETLIQSIRMESKQTSTLRTVFQRVCLFLTPVDLILGMERVCKAWNNLARHSDQHAFAWVQALEKHMVRSDVLDRLRDRCSSSRFHPKHLSIIYGVSSGCHPVDFGCPFKRITKLCIRFVAATRFGASRGVSSMQRFSQLVLPPSVTDLDIGYESPGSSELTTMEEMKFVGVLSAQLRLHSATMRRLRIVGVTQRRTIFQECLVHVPNLRTLEYEEGAEGNNTEATSSREPFVASLLWSPLTKMQSLDSLTYRTVDGHRPEATRALHSAMAGLWELCSLQIPLRHLHWQLGRNFGDLFAFDSGGPKRTLLDFMLELPFLETLHLCGTELDGGAIRFAHAPRLQHISIECVGLKSHLVVEAIDVHTLPSLTSLDVRGVQWQNFLPALAVVQSGGVVERKPGWQASFAALLDKLTSFTWYDSPVQGYIETSILDALLHPPPSNVHRSLKSVRLRLHDRMREAVFEKLGGLHQKLHVKELDIDIFSGMAVRRPRTLVKEREGKRFGITIPRSWHDSKETRDVTPSAGLTFTQPALACFTPLQTAAATMIHQLDPCHICWEIPGTHINDEFGKRIGVQCEVQTTGIDWFGITDRPAGNCQLSIAEDRVVFLTASGRFGHVVYSPPPAADIGRMIDMYPREQRVEYSVRPLQPSFILP